MVKSEEGGEKEWEKEDALMIDWHLVRGKLKAVRHVANKKIQENE